MLWPKFASVVLMTFQNHPQGIMKWLLHTWLCSTNELGGFCPSKGLGYNQRLQKRDLINWVI